ncbi:MAG: hypothetical protein WCO35_02510 [Candidatus Nomurabacteria bacterium]
MSDIFKKRFKDANYIPTTGFLNEKKLIGVNHICIHDDCVIFNDTVLPFGAKDIEEKSTEVIDEILYDITHIIQSDENKEKKIIVCGPDKARRMFGRKLEDRLKREVQY